MMPITRTKREFDNNDFLPDVNSDIRFSRNNPQLQDMPRRKHNNRTNQLGIYIY